MVCDPKNELRNPATDAEIKLIIGVNAAVVEALRAVVEIASHYEAAKNKYPDETAVIEHVVTFAIENYLPKLLSEARLFHSHKNQPKKEN